MPTRSEVSLIGYVWRCQPGGDSVRFQLIPNGGGALVQVCVLADSAACEDLPRPGDRVTLRGTWRRPGPEFVAHRMLVHAGPRGLRRLLPDAEGALMLGILSPFLYCLGIYVGFAMGIQFHAASYCTNLTYVPAFLASFAAYAFFRFLDWPACNARPMALILTPVIGFSNAYVLSSMPL